MRGKTPKMQMEAHTFSIGDRDYDYATVFSSPPKRRAGRTKFRETRHPIYKGVRHRGRGGAGAGRWVCEVREPNKKTRIWLGSYTTPEMAARAHDVAALALRGRKACLNFADSAWRLPVPDSTTPTDIRRAAVAAAEAFRPGDDDAEGSEEEEMDSTMEGDGNVEGFDPEDLGSEMGCYYYYASLAEGLLVDPPPMTWMGHGYDDVDGCGDVALWSYSV